MEDLENGILLKVDRTEDTEPEVLYTCDMCGADIVEGEDYYEIDGDRYCEHCCEHKIAGW